MTTKAKFEPVPEKVDLANLPTAQECSSCGLTYCDCEVCDGSNTVQVKPVEDVPAKNGSIE